MSGFSGSPKIVKGGLVLLDPETGALMRLIALQYNPDTLSRTLQIQSVAGDGQNRSEPLRLKGPPVETIKVEAELDATDQLEFPDRNSNTVAAGLLPQLAALETIIYPTSQSILSNHALAQQGTLEIAPMESSLVLFVWSSNRIVPVRLTEFSVTEEAFDVNLNPIRAKVSLGMRVLTIDDFSWSDRGAGLYMVYQQQKEALARRAPAGSIAALGLPGGQTVSGQSPGGSMNAQLQALLQPLGLGSTAYPPSSRYSGQPMSSMTLPDGRTVTWLKRRIVPNPANFGTQQTVTVREGDRIDRLAAQYLGDPLAFWRLCDANGALAPDDLTATPGATLSIPLPAGMGTSSGA